MSLAIDFIFFYWKRKKEKNKERNNNKNKKETAVKMLIFNVRFTNEGYLKVSDIRPLFSAFETMKVK